MTETPEQMHARLCDVIGQARFSILDEPYAWQPIARTAALSDNALAVVRDGMSWAALLPAKAAAAGAYRVFAFHFAEGSNASGFVAWLASLMKVEAGTGAMVVCGACHRCTVADIVRAVRLLGMSVDQRRCGYRARAAPAPVG